MKLITEMNEDVRLVTEKTEDGKKNYYIEGIFMQAEQKNRNGRWKQLRIYWHFGLIFLEN